MNLRCGLGASTPAIRRFSERPASIASAAFQPAAMGRTSNLGAARSLSGPRLPAVPGGQPRAGACIATASCDDPRTMWGFANWAYACGAFRPRRWHGSTDERPTRRPLSPPVDRHRGRTTVMVIIFSTQRAKDTRGCGDQPACKRRPASHPGGRHRAAAIARPAVATSRRDRVAARTGGRLRPALLARGSPQAPPATTGLSPSPPLLLP